MWKTLFFPQKSGPGGTKFVGNKFIVTGLTLLLINLCSKSTYGKKYAGSCQFHGSVSCQFFRVGFLRRGGGEGPFSIMLI